MAPCSSVCQLVGMAMKLLPHSEEVLGLNLPAGLVLLVLAWASSGRFDFLPQSKDVQIGLT